MVMTINYSNYANYKFNKAILNVTNDKATRLQPCVKQNKGLASFPFRILNSWLWNFQCGMAPKSFFLTIQFIKF